MLEKVISGAPGSPVIHSVAVIGAGTRGRAFALLCARSGFQVFLEDVLSSNLRQAEEQLAKQDQADRDRVQLVNSVEDAVRDADLTIDFVPDELESKLEIFSMVDRMAPPRTIICTPTSLSIADLASCTYRPQACVGLAPFGDELGKQVVLVHGSSADPGCLEAAKAFFERLGPEVTTAKDDAVPSCP